MSNQSPFGGFYYDSSGNLIDLLTKQPIDPKEIPSYMTPFNGVFYDANGDLHDLTQLSSIGGIQTENDPIYLTDKPNIALKSELEAENNRAQAAENLLNERACALSDRIGSVNNDSDSKIKTLQDKLSDIEQNTAGKLTQKLDKTDTAADSARLNNQPANYYATADELGRTLANFNNELEHTEEEIGKLQEELTDLERNTDYKLVEKLDKTGGSTSSSFCLTSSNDVTISSGNKLNLNTADNEAFMYVNGVNPKDVLEGDQVETVGLWWTGSKLTAIAVKGFEWFLGKINVLKIASTKITSFLNFLVHAEKFTVSKTGVGGSSGPNFEVTFDGNGIVKTRIYEGYLYADKGIFTNGYDANLKAKIDGNARIQNGSLEVYSGSVDNPRYNSGELYAERIYTGDGAEVYSPDNMPPVYRTVIITATQQWKVPVYDKNKGISVRLLGGGGAGRVGTSDTDQSGGGGGGHMVASVLYPEVNSVIPVTIGAAGVSPDNGNGGNGGPSSFGTLLTANGGNGGSGSNGGDGGTGGGAGNYGKGGNASYGGGGGSMNGTGGTGGTYGGGGGGGYTSGQGGAGGVYGGKGGNVNQNGEPGTDTTGLSLDFVGYGLGGSKGPAGARASSGGGGGGYGGNGGNGSLRNDWYCAGGGGGGYGGNGGNANGDRGGGGGGYGGNGFSGGIAVNGFTGDSAGGGGGGYGSDNYGCGGTGNHNGIYSNQKDGVCIIQYWEKRGDY
ncbi:MAG: hypothetical protein LBR74_09390 [Eubacterium sp.]|jgi:DNA uptake protein ComE-like DNA-binding protein|nr:hypothetical protein [Eubacterium sp.]